MRKPRHLQAVQAALTAMMYDSLTDSTKLRNLEQINAEVTGLILDLRARLPEPPSRRADPPRI